MIAIVLLFQLMASGINADVNITRQWLAHTGGVDALAITDDFIYSGGLDRLVSIWHRSNNTLYRNMTGHRLAINSLITASEYLFTGSGDGMIIQWWLDGNSIF